VKTITEGANKMAGKGQITSERVRKRLRDHPKGTSDRILRNFRLHMRAPFQGNPEGWRLMTDVISGQMAPLGRILRNFRLRIRAPFQGKKKRGKWLCMCTRSLPWLPVRAASRHVAQWSDPPEKWLEP